jgi:iron complex transport system substrate-binding protein
VAIRIVDDLGRAIVLPRFARRIISLAPSVTEHIHDAGAGKTLVGTTSYCDYPVAVQTLPRVGDFTRPSYERIVALKPDLVVVESGTITRDAAETLSKRLGVPVYVMLSTSFMAIGKHIEAMGAITGIRSGIASAQHRIRETLATVKRIQGASKTQPKVLMVISETPLFVAGPDGYLGDIIKLAGGQNIIKTGSFPQVTPETVMLLDPDIILVGADTNGRPYPLTGPLRALRAARENRIQCIPGGNLGRPTLRTSAGVVELARIIHRGK